MDFPVTTFFTARIVYPEVKEVLSEVTQTPAQECL